MSDLAADARAATPTAAAHLVAYDEKELLSFVFQKLSQMGLSLQQRANVCEKDYARVAKEIERNASRIFERSETRVKSLIAALSSSRKLFVQKKENDLERALVRLSASDPLAVIGKGYFAASANGKRVVSAKDVAVGDEIELIAKDGALKAQIKEIKYEF